MQILFIWVAAISNRSQWGRQTHWIRLFNWDRALELAVRHKTHVDTVRAEPSRRLVWAAAGQPLTR